MKEIIGIIIIAFILCASACFLKWNESLKPEPECPFEGGECPNAIYYMRNYQLLITDGGDSFHLYRGDLEIGAWKPTYTTPLDSLIMWDNSGKRFITKH